MSAHKIIAKRSDRAFLTLATIFLLVAAPATISTVWYYFNGKSGARPLSITREFEALNGLGGGVAIIATVSWAGAGEQAYSKEHLQNRLNRAFSAHGEEVFVVFKDHSGTRTTVTFSINESTYGPVRPEDAARFVRPAIETLRLRNR